MTEKNNSVTSITSEKTTSDKTSSRESDLIAERDEDFTKDNAASPIDLECHIQAERMTKILNEAIDKTKIGVSFSSLVHDYYHLLEKIFTEQDLDDFMYIHEHYDMPYHSGSLVNMEAMEGLREGDYSLKNRVNPELGHIMYILNKYEKLKPVVDKIIIRTRNKLPLEYLVTLEKFREVLIKRMEMSAAEDLAAKITTRKVEKSNNIYITEINGLEKKIKEEYDAFVATMKIKNKIIAALKQELGFLDNVTQARLLKQVADSEREMVMNYRVHKVKNEMIKEEEVERREAYGGLLHRSLLDEKNQRARRLKVEAQLLSWIQKYDGEMTTKQEELDDYIEKYKDEEKKVEKLEKDLEEQDLKYLPLMQERDEEYHQEMTDKMNAFLIEHAARVIQSAWRQVLINRVEKKKLKKAIQKMKEAAEKAALKAEKEAKKAEALAKREEKRRKKEAKAEKLRLAKEAKEAAAAAKAEAKK